MSAQSEASKAIADSFVVKWIAHMRDGTFLPQFEEDYTQHRLAELEQRAGEIDYIELTGLPIPIVVDFPKLSTPIIFERVRRDNDTSGNSVESRFIYVGFQAMLGAAVYKSCVVVHMKDNQFAGISVVDDDATTRSLVS